jgi:magnesium-transporting ATPase (P-type)
MWVPRPPEIVDDLAIPPCCARPCPQAKECMVFAGSAIANGAGTGIVVATGMGTEIGKIQSDIQVGRVVLIP